MRTSTGKRRKTSSSEKGTGGGGNGGAERSSKRLSQQHTEVQPAKPVYRQSRDFDVELALNDVHSARPVDLPFPFLTIDALADLTPRSITAEDIRVYALHYKGEGYERDASQRGVIVHKVDGYDTMKTHYLFVLFDRGADVPALDAEYRTRFNRVRHLVSDLWEKDDEESRIVLSEELYKRPLVRHSHENLHLSLAAEFLGMGETTRAGHVTRDETTALLCKLSTVMSMGHPSLLQVPRKEAKGAAASSSSSPSTSSSSSSSSSSFFSSSETPPPSVLALHTEAATAGVGTGTPTTSTTTTDMDTNTGTEASSGAVLGRSFVEQLEDLQQDQKEEAFRVIRDETKKQDLFCLRTVLRVPSSTEVTPESIAKRASEEAKHLTKVMTEHARGLGRTDRKGVLRFVTNDAVLVDVDWKADLERKRLAAPILMAILASVLQAESWYYDRSLMENFVADAKKGEGEGRVKNVGGRLLRVVGGGACEEREVLCKTHSKRRKSLGDVEAELDRRSNSLLAALVVISDIIIAARCRGQAIISLVLLCLSVACAQVLSRTSYDLLSSVKLLLPRTTAVSVIDEAAKVYKATAFINGVIEMAKKTAETAAALMIPYAIGLQVDNYVTDQGVRRHLLGSGASNFVQVPTETRMLAGCKTNTLEATDGGYGSKYDHSRTTGLFGPTAAAPGLLSSAADSVWSFKSDVLNSSLLACFSTMLIGGDLPTDGNGPFHLGEHMLAPQVEACSASRNDFKTHVLDWAKSIFGVIWLRVHLFFVFDTEYVPHYMSWVMRGGATAELMANTAVFPCKFHIRKHLAETLLMRKKVLQFIMVPILLGVLPTSKKKWEAVGMQAAADRGDSRATDAEATEEADADAAAGDDDDDDDADADADADALMALVEAAQNEAVIEDGVDAVIEEGGADEVDVEMEVVGDGAAAAAAAAADGDDDEDDGDDEEFADRKKTELTTEALVRRAGIGNLRKICRGCNLDDTGKHKDVANRVIDHFGVRPDYAAMWEAKKETIRCKADFSRKGIPIGLIRFVCAENGIETEDGDGKNLEKKLLLGPLVKALGLREKRERKEKEWNELVRMNLHRLNRLYFHLFFLWDGAAFGGKVTRSRVIDLCKDKYRGALSDEEAVRAASENSAYFAGLWQFFDVELRMAVEPFALWERGDVSLFLRLFPLMVLYVAASNKPKVTKVFIMLAERLKLYVDNHVNVVKLFAANCRQFDEEKIEFMNAVIGRWIKARIKDLSIEHYTRVTCVMKLIRSAAGAFSKLVNRKDQDDENEKLNTMYTNTRWGPTNSRLVDWIEGEFQKALNGDFDDALWPRENPFAKGHERIPKHMAETETWMEKQSQLRDGEEEDEEDNNESSEEEDGDGSDD